MTRARSLTLQDPEVFRPALTGLFASAGVALAWIPELEGAPISGAGVVTPEEREADRFAADFLIPPDEYGRLLAKPLSTTGIEAFAARIGVAPGIVVGRLQHDRRLRFHAGNGRKRRLRWQLARDVPAATSRRSTSGATRP